MFTLTSKQLKSVAGGGGGYTPQQAAAAAAAACKALGGKVDPNSFSFKQPSSQDKSQYSGNLSGKAYFDDSIDASKKNPSASEKSGVNGEAGGKVDINKTDNSGSFEFKCKDSKTDISSPSSSDTAFASNDYSGGGDSYSGGGDSYSGGGDSYFG